MRIYGVLEDNGNHVDISRSLLSTKRYATKYGYSVITCRYNYNAVMLYDKVDTRWIERKSKNK